MLEGFAHFYAALSFNRADQGDCWFEAYRAHDGETTVDCEKANPPPSGFVQQYARNNCNIGSATDRGVELDWLRAFWEVQTAGANPPTFEQVLDWLDMVDYNADDLYDSVDGAAEVSDPSVRTNWDSAKINQGLQ
jgi:hypothetical protein